jgi:hypothetical protein
MAPASSFVSQQKIRRMINWRTLGFGLVFGLIDSIALPTIKQISRGGLGRGWMAVPFLLYAASPFLFLKALMGGETLTIMNLVWDLMSDVVVTLIGMAVFSEVIPPVKLVGVAFSFLSLFLMTYEGDGWNEYIASNTRRAIDAFL